MPLRIRRALVSVSDKTGVVELGQALAAAGVEILSTGGTFKTLQDAGVAVVEVAAHTGFPDDGWSGKATILKFRRYFGAARHGRRHHGREQWHDDLIVVNLYPFAATIAQGIAPTTGNRNIGGGGPAMMRSVQESPAS